MRISYGGMDFRDLRGDLIADYLIAVDAHLMIDDGVRVVLDEPAFPVVELARSLVSWLNTALRAVFEFVSMSAEERGIVTISPQGDGWCVYSTCTPDIRSSVVNWAAIEWSVRDLIRMVRRDLEERGLDSERILGLTSQNHDD